MGDRIHMNRVCVRLSGSRVGREGKRAEGTFRLSNPEQKGFHLKKSSSASAHPSLPAAALP